MKVVEATTLLNFCVIYRKIVMIFNSQCWSLVQEPCRLLFHLTQRTTLTAQSYTPFSTSAALLHRPNACAWAVKHVRVGTKAIDQCAPQHQQSGATTAPAVHQQSIGITQLAQGLRKGILEAFWGLNWAAQWAVQWVATGVMMWL